MLLCVPRLPPVLGWKHYLVAGCLETSGAEGRPGYKCVVVNIPSHTASKRIRALFGKSINVCFLPILIQMTDSNRYPENSSNQGALCVLLSSQIHTVPSETMSSSPESDTVLGTQ